MSEALLSLSGVHTHVGPYHLLQGVDLEVPEGEVTALLGRNGAGKTTTLRTIMGLWRPSAGRIAYAGRDVTATPTPDLARAGIAYVPETMAVFADLTVRENLILAARSGPPDPARLERILGHFPALRTFWSVAAGVLSGGQKQMLSVARALVEPRRLILVDEPTKGLSPAIVGNLQAAFRDLKAERTTMILVEQNVAFAEALSDRVAVMDGGRIVHAGGMADFAADPALARRLLGLSLEPHP